ncbi:alpha/beta hydrolase family protein [Pseudaminobacter salicylatoxidans]|uniref:Alpha/beta hydrolase family protein n=1 Tax=Pseudaminobacter salicylatoxidans TaxID=93369 RepID=A0A316C647_PSESE|nr:alpha/beta hydrolase [Pseudaminobacter salicylatoxidans]PWJ85171.1 alpha/beta hydrolase family protein [Pseudaminobacter salicylatoxidans]
MSASRITDWDKAYSNTIYIPEGPDYPAKWEVAASAFRDEMRDAGRLREDISYGPHTRNRYDLFLPKAGARGLVVFVHGGFWMAFDKSAWSHLAAGPLAHGYAVAVPSYILTPEARVSDITRQIGAAIAAAAREIDGPLYIAGHSAGGHLVSRMTTATSPLQPDLAARLRKTVSISGLHDLRPLLNTEMNETLRLDIAEAHAESVALLEPLDGIDITCWVGADERPEFLRQNRLLENLWSSFNIEISSVEEAGRHHFDVIEGLADPDHRLVRTLLGV